MRVKLNLRQVAVSLIAATCGIAVGALAILVIGWLSKNPTIFGAHWWDALSAFGTVGAVAISLTFPIVGYLTRQNELRDERLISAAYASNTIFRAFHSLADVSERLFEILRQKHGRDLYALFEDTLSSVGNDLQDCKKWDGPVESGRLVEELQARRGELVALLKSLDDPASAIRTCGDVRPYMSLLFASLVWQGERIQSYRQDLYTKLGQRGLKEDLMWPRVTSPFEDNLLFRLRSYSDN